MPTAPVSNLTLKILTGIFIYIVFQLNFFSVWQLGFGWKAALVDAGINLVLQIVAAAVIENIFRFYQPRLNQLWIAVGMSALFGMLLVIFAKLLIGLLPAAADYTSFLNRSTGIRIGFSILLMSCISILTIVWNMLRRERENNNRKRETERLSREAELFKLRQQLQPHFLFKIIVMVFIDVYFYILEWLPIVFSFLGQIHIVVHIRLNYMLKIATILYLLRAVLQSIVEVHKVENKYCHLFICPKKQVHIYTTLQLLV